MKIRYYTHRGVIHMDFRADGKRYRPSTGCTTQQDAENAAAGIIAKTLSAAASPNAPSSVTVPPQMGGPTIEEAYKLALKVRDKWIQAKDKKTIEQTYESLGQKPDTPMAIFNRDKVRLLRSAWLDEPGKRTGTTLQPSTVNHRLSMLSVLLEVLDLPPHGVKHLKLKDGRKRRISDEELAEMREWCEENMHRAGVPAFSVAIPVALETGAREGELIDLVWRDVRGNSLTFRDTKNGEDRTIPLEEDVQALLEARRGLARPFSDLTADRITKLWKDMRASMGLHEDTQFVFHTLRHERAGRLAEGGVNTLIMQALLGHKKITTTQGYTHPSLVGMRKALATMKEAAR